MNKIKAVVAAALASLGLASGASAQGMGDIPTDRFYFSADALEIQSTKRKSHWVRCSIRKIMA